MVRGFALITLLAIALAATCASTALAADSQSSGGAATMRKLSNALAGDAGDGTRGSINRKTGNAHTKAEKPLISAVFHGEPLDGGALSLDPGKPTAQRTCTVQTSEDKVDSGYLVYTSGSPFCCTALGSVLDGLCRLYEEVHTCHDDALFESPYDYIKYKKLCYTSCYRLNPSDPTKSAASLFASYSGSLIFSENVHYSAGSSVFDAVVLGGSGHKSYYGGAYTVTVADEISSTLTSTGDNIACMYKGKIATETSIEAAHTTTTVCKVDLCTGRTRNFISGILFKAETDVCYSMCFTK